MAEKTIFFAQDLNILTPELELSVGNTRKLEECVEIIPKEASERPKQCMIEDNTVVCMTESGDLEALAPGKTKVTIVCDYGAGACNVTVIGTTEAQAPVDILTLEMPKITKIKNISSGIRIRWSDVEGAEGYEIYKLDHEQWAKIADVDAKNTCEYVDQMVLSGRSYHYSVRAWNREGESAYIDNQKKICYLAPVTTLAAAARAGYIELKWKGISGAQRYLLYRKEPKKMWEKLAVLDAAKENLYRDEHVVNGMQYEYLVIAYNQYGIGAYEAKGRECTYNEN